MDEGWDEIEQADVMREPEAPVIGTVDDEEPADDLTGTQVPIGAPEPHRPSQAEVDAHNLSHINYRAWCPHCLMGRRPASQHRSQSNVKRTVPLFCSDYAQVRDSQDEEYAQLLVGRLYPPASVQRILFGTVCDSKGGDDDASINRLSAFFKETGTWRLVYKTDQESSIKVMVDEALRRTGRSGVFESYQAVPEYSAVGSSQSNGRAERAVQALEDQLRTLKSALESRMNCRLPADHPVFRWLVEHAVSLINRFKTHEDGQTAYQFLHGKRASDKIVEFGEQVFFSVPKKLRSKLCRRWRIGTYLGVVSSSNEHYVSLRNGNVIKARSVVRVILASRWSSEQIMKVQGTPSKLCPTGDEDILPEIEQMEEPHVDRDHQDRILTEGEPIRGSAEPDPRLTRKVNMKAQPRITAKDHRLYGHTAGCPRCEDLIRKKHDTNKQHSDECRLGFYMAWQQNKDPKYELIRHLFEPDAAQRDELGTVEIDDGPSRQHSKTPREDKEDLSWLVEDEVPGPAPETPVGRPWQETFAEVEPTEVFHYDEPAPEYSPFSPDDSEMGSPNEDEAMVDHLKVLGVPDQIARDKIMSMRSQRPAATFTEVYGGGAIVDCANHARRSLNLKGLRALDLRTTKPDGTPWDFTVRADRRLARQLIDADDPDWLIGSPPCTPFSIWNYAMNYPKMSKEKVRAAVEAGRTHLNFVVSLYRKQMIRGKYFVHEHPATALSRKEETVLALLKSPLIHAVVADQCMYGLTAPAEGDPSSRLPAMKPTRFMTNSVHMANRLSTRCDKSHVHQQLVGGRARDAAFYPLPLVEAILGGISDTADADHRQKMAEEEQRAMINAVSQSAGTIPVSEDLEAPKMSSVKKVTGGVLPIAYHSQNFRARYIDEYTGEVLDPLLISSAIMEELDYFNDRVWQVELREDMLKVPDHVFVRSRWVNCNKGDALNPDIRARLVACEVNKGDKHDSFFASTPPLEAKKLLFAEYAKQRTRDGKPLRLSFIDVRKAYFNGIPKRPLYMAFPKEMGLPSNLVAKQVRCVYGTRDAGAIWEDTYRGALEELGFQSGAASPCCFYHPGRKLSVVVHGDDFTTLGLDGDLDWFESELAKNFELKLRGRLGEGTECQQLRILNRIVTITKDGLTYEADPRHADIMMASMGLTSANAALTPGVKEPEADYESDKRDEATATTFLDGIEPEIVHDKQIHSLQTKDERRHEFNRQRRIRFNTDAIEYFDIPAYSTIYGTAPRFLASTAQGMVSTSSHCDPFTSKSGSVMEARRLRHSQLHDYQTAHDYRLQLLSVIQSIDVPLDVSLSKARIFNSERAQNCKISHLGQSKTDVLDSGIQARSDDSIARDDDNNHESSSRDTHVHSSPAAIFW